MTIDNWFSLLSGILTLGFTIFFLGFILDNTKLGKLIMKVGMVIMIASMLGFSLLMISSAFI